MNPPHFDTIPAQHVTSQTLVGGNWGSFPRKWGNCFSVMANNREYKILNFKVENLDHVMKKNNIPWPIQIHVLSENCAVIHDPRIPHDFYDDSFCPVCSPYDLLPMPQKLLLARRVLTKEDEYRDGCVISSIKPDPAKPIRLDWKIEESKTPVVLFNKDAIKRLEDQP